MEKLKAQLKWALKVAKEMNDHESARHKRYYDQKYKCMKVVPSDLVLVRVKAFSPDHKIADQWEQTSFKVLAQHKDTPVYIVKPLGQENTDSIQMLYRNMLIAFQSSRKEYLTETPNQALINADLAMMSYFS